MPHGRSFRDASHDPLRMTIPFETKFSMITYVGGRRVPRDRRRSHPKGDPQFPIFVARTYAKIVRHRATNFCQLVLYRIAMYYYIPEYDFHHQNNNKKLS